MLNNRQRFWRSMRFQPIDRVPFWADWLGPFERWRHEGMTAEPNRAGEPGTREWFVHHFGFEGMYSAFWGTSRVPVHIGVWPGLDPEVLQDTLTYKIVRSGNGAIVKQFKTAPGSLNPTQFLEYPIKGRADWEEFRNLHLNPDADGRYPPDSVWQEHVTAWQQRSEVLTIDGGSFYGFLRDWIGVENLSLMLYDDPDLIHEMMDYLAWFYVRVLHRALHDIDIDFAMFWEDMCYKNGPLLSPQMFREFMLPNYVKVTSFLNRHGVELSWVDCDGNIETLLPLWIEGGVRGFYPLEVASGMDAGRLRAEYGPAIVLWGNVDKRALAQGRATIDAEMARLEPIVRQGGFIPLVDHAVPDDVPYEHYLYYLEQRKRITGYPHDLAPD